MSVDVVGVVFEEQGSRVVARSFEDVGRRAEQAESAVKGLQETLKNAPTSLTSDMGRQFGAMKGQVTQVTSAVSQLKLELSTMMKYVTNPGEIANVSRMLDERFRRLNDRAGTLNRRIQDLNNISLSRLTSELGQLELKFKGKVDAAQQSLALTSEGQHLTGSYGRPKNAAGEEIIKQGDFQTRAQEQSAVEALRAEDARRLAIMKELADKDREALSLVKQELEVTRQIANIRNIRRGYQENLTPGEGILRNSNWRYPVATQMELGPGTQRPAQRDLFPRTPVEPPEPPVAVLRGDLIPKQASLAFGQMATDIRNANEQAGSLAGKFQQIGTIGQQVFGFLPELPQQFAAASQGAEQLGLFMGKAERQMHEMLRSAQATPQQDAIAQIKNNAQAKLAALDEEELRQKDLVLAGNLPYKEMLRIIRDYSEQRKTIERDMYSALDRMAESHNKKQLDFLKGGMNKQDYKAEQMGFGFMANMPAEKPIQLTNVVPEVKSASDAVEQLTLNFRMLETVGGKATAAVANGMKSSASSVHDLIADLRAENEYLQRSYEERQRISQHQNVMQRTGGQRPTAVQESEITNLTAANRALQDYNREYERLRQQFTTGAEGTYSNRQRALNQLLKEGVITTEQYKRAQGGLRQQMEQTHITIGGVVRQLWYLRTAMEMIGGFLFLRELRQAADGWINYTNSIKLSTNSQQEAAAVENRLFEAAQRARIPIEDAATLYRRTSLASQSLGASQGDIIKFIEGVGMALAVQGTTAEAARGSLLQLGQMLGMGKVRMQEFTSISENAPRILLAMVRNIDEKVVPSIGNLRRVIEEQNRRGTLGKVDLWKMLNVSDQNIEINSKVLFEAFLRGIADLKKEFADVQPTFQQTFNQLHNEFTRYIGDVNRAWDASGKFNSMILWMTKNITGLGAALAGVSTAGLVLGLPGALKGLQSVIGATKTLKEVNGVMTVSSGTGILGFLAANPWVAIAAAIAGVGAVMYSLRDSFYASAQEGITYGDVMRAIWDDITKAIKGAVNAIRSFLGLNDKVKPYQWSPENLFGGEQPNMIQTGGSDATLESPYADLVKELSALRGVDANLAESLMKIESGYNPDALSGAGAKGLMQLMPKTAEELGVDRDDPTQNLEGGIRYLSQTIEKFKNSTDGLWKGITAYNTGPNNKLLNTPGLSREEIKAGLASNPRTAEGATYADKVLAEYNRRGGLAANGGNLGPVASNPMEQMANEASTVPSGLMGALSTFADVFKDEINTFIGQWKTVCELIPLYWNNAWTVIVGTQVNKINELVDSLQAYINATVIAARLAEKGPLGMAREIATKGTTTTLRDLFTIPEDFKLPKMKNPLGEQAKDIAKQASEIIAKNLNTNYIGNFWAEKLKKAKDFMIARLKTQDTGTDLSGKPDTLQGPQENAMAYAKAMDQLRSSIDPLYGAHLKLEMALNQVDDAVHRLDQNGQPLIKSMADYDRLIQQVNDHFAEALDPVGTMIDRIEQERQALMLNHNERKAALRTLELERTLRHQLPKEMIPDALAMIQAEEKVNAVLQERANLLDKLINKMDQPKKEAKLLPDIEGQFFGNRLGKAIEAEGMVNTPETFDFYKVFPTAKMKEAMNEAKMAWMDFSAEIRMNAGEGTFLDGFLRQLDLFSDKSRNYAVKFGQMFAQPVVQAIEGIGNAFARAIVYGDNLKESLGNLGREILTTLLSALIQLGIRMALTAALGPILAGMQVAAMAPIATEMALLWEPAAISASIATEGAAAAVGEIAYINALALGKAAALGGFSSGGYTGDFRRDAVAGYVHGQEFVVNAAATAKNRPLLEALNKTGKVPGTAGSSGTAAFGAPNFTIINQAPGVEIVPETVTAEDVVLIARREANQAVHRDAPKVIAAQMRDPNSHVSNAMTVSTHTRRRRT